MTDETLFIEIPIIVTQRDGLPAIEIRKGTTNIDIIKAIVESAFHQKPILIQPVFRDKLKSIGSLQDKGLLYKEQDGYFWTV